MVSCLVAALALGLLLAAPTTLIFTIAILAMPVPERIGVKVSQRSVVRVLVDLLIGAIAGALLGIVPWQIGMPATNREGAQGFVVVYVAIPRTVILIYLGMVAGAVVGTETGRFVVGGAVPTNKPQVTPTLLTRRLILAGSVVSCFLIAVASYVIWLGWHGYLLPVHYVQQANAGCPREEGYHIRHMCLWWPSKYDNWTKAGRWTIYDPDGTKRVEGTYNNRQCEIGTWTWYNRDGTIHQLVEHDERGTPIGYADYENGVAKKVVKQDYDQHGNLKGHTVTENGISKYEIYVQKSTCHWDDDPKKREEMENAYAAHVRNGATPEQAREAVIQEYHLRKSR
jgi:YD repeat-containing protein